MKTLYSDKYNLELFIADDIKLISFRDEIASMEHPFFAMKGGDTRIRKYKNGNTVIIIEPTISGIATIFDKDIWIYSISKLQESINNNQKINRVIYFTPYNFFITTNRKIGGNTYYQLVKSLKRLSGTRITTNIIYSDKKQKSIGFGLIDEWRIIDEKKGKLNIGMIEITLPNWLYQALHEKKVLKINPNYFRIRKAIDRRIYEIARKHCGTKNKFYISFEKLYLKVGSTSNKIEFKRMLKRLININNLPDYNIYYNEQLNIIIFNNRNIIN